MTIEKLNKYRWIITATATAFVTIAIVLGGRFGKGDTHQPVNTKLTKFPSPPAEKPLGEPTTGPETEPMGESPFMLCDLDYDGDCDEADEQIFADAFGKCLGEPGYNFDADVDGDGCVVTNDQQVFSNYVKYVNC